MDHTLRFGIGTSCPPPDETCELILKQSLINQIQDLSLDSNDKKDSVPASLKSHFFSDKTVPNFLEDYDCIGFDLDHCLVKYNVENFAK